MKPTINYSEMANTTNRDCVIHSLSSYEKERCPSKFKVEIKHDGGLQCSYCKRYTCSTCIKSFVHLLSTRLKRVQYCLLKEQVFKDMINFTNNCAKGLSTFSTFTKKGPCCSIINITASHSDDIMFDHDNSTTYNVHPEVIIISDDDDEDDHSKEANNTSTCKKQKCNETSIENKQHNKRKRRRYDIRDKIKDSIKVIHLDGALHVPSHHVLLHAPIGFKTTHAMGDQQDLQERGLFHGVVTPDVANSISMEEFSNSPKQTTIIRSYSTQYEVLNTDGKTISRKTWWIELAIDKSVTTLKHCNPTRENIMQSSFIDLPDGYDTYAILGQPMNDRAAYHLLQLMFVSDKSELSFSTNNMDTLYNSLLPRAGKQGMESSRSGGSQGKCVFNKLMKKHMKHPGNFPRHTNGMMIIILNSSQRCGYIGIYSCPYEVDGSLKLWFYNTPRVGGHQQLTREQLMQFPLLMQFPSCRIESAQLMNFRNTKLPYRKVCPTAVVNMLGEWQDALKVCEQDSFRNLVGYYMARRCRLTLLAHAVGYHKDTFSNNNGDKIENKILLVSKDRSDTSSQVALGRGGAGPGIFVYALLDW